MRQCVAEAQSTAIWVPLTRRSETSTYAGIAIARQLVITCGNARRWVTAESLRSRTPDPANAAQTVAQRLDISPRHFFLAETPILHQSSPITSNRPIEPHSRSSPPVARTCETGEIWAERLGSRRASEPGDFGPTALLENERHDLQHRPHRFTQRQLALSLLSFRKRDRNFRHFRTLTV